MSGTKLRNKNPVSDTLIDDLKKTKHLSEHNDLQSKFRYRRSIVTFIDILGFKQMVHNSAPDRIGTVLSILAAASQDETTSGDHLAGQSRTVRFSDSIVRVCPIDSDNRLGALFKELIELAYIQAELASEGVFLRGGVTIGQVYYNENQIFGPAMIRAYELETDYANYPRIVIDPDVFEFHRCEPALQGDQHDLEEDIAYLNQITTVGDDELRYIDYLKAMHPEGELSREYKAFLLTHRDHIVAESNKLNGFNKAKHKYFWLSNYHNKSLSDLVEDTLGEIYKINLDTLNKR